MYKELKEILINYECTFIDDKELLFALCTLLYDKEIVSGTELDRLYDRVQKLTHTIQ